MRRLYNQGPELSGHYYVVPRPDCRSVLAFKMEEYQRFYPVLAIGEPLRPTMGGFVRLSTTPLPHLPQP